MYEVIDGQQRITTLFIYLCAAVKTLCDLQEYSEAAGLMLKYLLIGRETQLVSNFKLHSCKDDRAQLNYVFEDIFSDDNLVNKLGGVKIKRLPTNKSEPNGVLKNNYRSALRFFKEQYKQEGLDRVRAIYEALLSSVSIVQIDVWDPTNGPKIFDSLNSRQEPMTIGDLVRNEIFSRVADHQPDDIEHLDEHYWQPFYRRFQQNGNNLFDSYFFPYGLIQDPNTKKSEVYSNLRTSWQKIYDPEKIIRELAKYQNAFIDLVSGSNNQKHSKEISGLFLNLYNANMPSATFPFLMQLSNAIKDGSIKEDDGSNILEIIESFLVRRAICGHEPTGLHAVFKRLWADCDSNPTPEKVKKNIKSHKTVVWPGKEETINAIMNRSLYGSGITSYILLEHNKSLKGDVPQNIPWIEHVLPQNPESDWFKVFTPEQHAKSRDLLANLIPLSKEMNKEVSNKIYKTKRAKFLDDSMFKSARQFAQTYDEWNPKNLLRRGEELSEWAVKRWRY